MKCADCKYFQDNACTKERSDMDLECLVRCLLCVTTDIYELMSEDFSEGEEWKYGG